MAVEYSGGTVKLSLDFQSAKNALKEKLSRINLGVVLAGLFIIAVSWLAFLSSKIRSLQDENEMLKSGFQILLPMCNMSFSFLV